MSQRIRPSKRRTPWAVVGRDEARRELLLWSKSLSLWARILNPTNTEWAAAAYAATAPYVWRGSLSRIVARPNNPAEVLARVEL